MMLNTEDIDKLIIGRVDPHIYAFSTNTIPNYLKVGDTYRPVSVRLAEWKNIFPELEHNTNWEWIAKTKDGKYFRDFAVHYYLEKKKKLQRLRPDEVEENVYYSREFFKNATPTHVDEAILDIERCAAIADNVQYQFYTEEHLPIDPHYERIETYPLRPNQKAAVDAFLQARANGRNNLLMYAVMRFGKSFTSMCCAAEMQAKVVLIVSAKADVCTEWQRTVESHVRFEKYDFLNSEALLADEKAISKRLAEGKCVAVFLTLQDLMGEDIKTKHLDLFSQQIDLLIVDETHFGARANEYGRILRASQLNALQIINERKGADDSLDDLEKGLEQIKQFKVDTTLHLSGTPYRILMGSEFKQEDIIAFCQFTDIIKDKEKWDENHAKDIDNEVLNPQTKQPYQEWDNPYYGFPQMIRFAFNPNTSAQQLITQLKNEGKTTALNELFRPQSISCDTGNKKHKLFVHEKEVLDLLRIIDGSAEDENILSFLDYDKLKEGKMCRHMVLVLPFCASCDAMQHLLQIHVSEFKNLQEYVIVNIAGLENTFSSTEEIKQKIKDLEKEDKKSITLTVNRMLTGSTIPQWDTMLFLKDISSPQEYDQAIFRLQNQYVNTYKSEKDGIVKYDMKPQTLLVDFDPNRMFRMQEQKSQIYNVNADERGNEKLEERIAYELKVSPIIVANKDKLVLVTPTNIMDAVRDYSASRTVIEEAVAIPVDMDIIQDPNILEVLKKINPIDANKGISVKPAEGDGNGLDNPDNNTQEENKGDSGNTNNSKDGGDTTQTNLTDEEKLAKRLSSLFALILFYALLTDDDVKSLHDIIESIPNNSDNQRILGNLGLKLENLNYLQTHINPFVLRKLDYKIQTSNQLLKDTTYKPIERVERALKKFGRMSEAEIVTPAHVAKKMVALLPKMKETDRILDIASKQGEFACALYRRYKEKILNNVYSVPTSSVAYEFTRKVYMLLGMPVQNVYSTFNTYDLINNNYESHIKTLTNMNFTAVVGNPPYQQTVALKDTANGQKRVASIFHLLQNVAERIGKSTSLIYPGVRWLHRSGKGMEQFGRQQINDPHLEYIYFYPNANEIFRGVGIADGLTIVGKNMRRSFNKFSYNYIENGVTQTVALQHPGEELIPLNPKDAIIVNKINELVAKKKFTYLSQSILSQKLFAIESDFVETHPRLVRPYSAGAKFNPNTEIKLLTNDKSGKSGRAKWYITKRNVIVAGREYLDKWKVVVSSANAGGQKRSNQLEVLDNHSAFGRVKVALKTFETESEARNFYKYVASELIRFAFFMTDEALTSLAKQVPDMGNYRDDNGIIDFSGDVNAQLYTLYKITAKEQEYIKSVLLKKGHDN